MSFPYPQGEAFFTLDGIKTEKDGVTVSDTLKNKTWPVSYDATNEKEFPNFFLVEYAWNYCPAVGSVNCKKVRGLFPNGEHPRYSLKTAYARLWKTEYGHFDTVSFIYGNMDVVDGEKNLEGSMRKMITHGLCTDGGKFYDWEQGGSPEVRKFSSELLSMH
jgi:hypothetical protein